MITTTLMGPGFFMFFRRTVPPMGGPPDAPISDRIEQEDEEIMVVIQAFLHVVS